MSTPNITKAIASNEIKNGASLLLVNKTGIETTFDNSKDTEEGLESLAQETTNRFDDRTYYFPLSSGGGGNPFNQSLNTNDSPTFNKLSLSSGVAFPDGTIQTTAASGVSGSIEIPTANIDLHNGGIQSAQVLQFNNNSKQSVITGPTPAENTNAQRLIIQGQRGQGTGEGGDVYFWAGDADINGGDIKIYAGDADNPSSGQGGYINIDAGNGYNQGGNVTISAGNSSEYAGNVTITAGSAPLNSGVVYVRTGGGSKQWEFNNNGAVVFPNSTTVAVGTFDNSTGGNGGISLNCYVGYELNWQGGHLKSTYDNGLHTANIWCDSGLEFPGSGIDYMEINASGITFPDGTTQSSANIPSSNISDLSTAVSGLLSVSSVVSGSGIVVNNVGGTVTVNSKLVSDATGIPGASSVNNIVVISQADYNNLASVDPDTLYIIS